MSSEAKLRAAIESAKRKCAEEIAAAELEYAREMFEAYMKGKPQGFREAYSNRQRQIMDEYGPAATEYQVQLAMHIWASDYLGKKEQK